MALDYTLENTHASRVLIAIEAVLEGKAGKDAQSMSINGKEITRYSFEDLQKIRRVYLREYRQDLTDAGHIPRSGKIKTRFR